MQILAVKITFFALNFSSALDPSGFEGPTSVGAGAEVSLELAFEPASLAAASAA